VVTAQLEGGATLAVAPIGLAGFGQHPADFAAAVSVAAERCSAHDTAQLAGCTGTYVIDLASGYVHILKVGFE
jgi:hypothetical protein